MEDLKLFLRSRVGVSGLLSSENVRQDVGGAFAPKEGVAGACGGGGGGGGGGGDGGGFGSGGGGGGGGGDGGGCGSGGGGAHELAGMVTVDAFLWDDDDVEDMVDAGKLKRYWRWWCDNDYYYSHNHHHQGNINNTYTPGLRVPHAAAAKT